MSVILKSDGIDFANSTSKTLGALQGVYDPAATALPVTGSVSYFDIDVSSSIGGYYIAAVQPVNNTVFVRCTPVDLSGNVVPFSLSTMTQYGNAYSDVGAGNYTAATNAGLQWLNNQYSPTGLIIIEGSGLGSQSSFAVVSPRFQIRYIHQYYSNLTVQTFQAMTLGSSGVSSNSDFYKLRISASSGNLYGYTTQGIYRQ